MKRYFFLVTVFLYAMKMGSYAQEIRTVRLKQQRINTRPAGYYIAAVKDDRKDTGDIGSVRASVFSKKLVRINLPGGTAAGLMDFLRNNLGQDTLDNLPLSMHISRFEAVEETGGLHAESEVYMTLSFYSAENKLVEYSVSSSVSAGVDAFKYIEGQIRLNLDSVMTQFDKWFQQNRKNLQTSLNGPPVVVKVVFAEKTDEEGLIVYSPGNPLQLDDFRGKPDDYLPASAATFSGIDLKYNAEIRFGQVFVTVTITTIFDRTRSWCRANSRNKETLQHEQRHFDITAIKSCELARAIQAESFNRSDYVKEINRMYTQKQAETEKMQDQYDDETRHGQIPAMQEKWDIFVKQLLSKQSCY